MIKKILLVTASLNMGGIEKLTVAYSSYLDPKKYEIHYLIFGSEKHFFEDTVKKNRAFVHRIPLTHNRFTIYKNIRRTIREYGPFDIVHSHILFSSGLAMKAAYREHVPIRIAHSHDNLSYVKNKITNILYHKLMRIYLNRYSTKRLACSLDAGEFLFGKNFKKNHGQIIKNRIDIEKYRYSKTKRAKIRNELGITDEQLLIGTIGRLEKQKNQQFIIDIFKTKTINNLNPQAIIIGDGTERNNLLTLISNNKLDDRIKLIGTKEDIAGYLSAMDVFILPSIHEGLGIVLLEAQANGLTCITTKHIVPNEAKVLDSFIFLPLSALQKPEKWATEITRAYRTEPNTAIEELKRNDYDIKELKHDLENIYNDTKEQ